MGLTWAKKTPTVKSTRVEENAIFHSGGKSRIELNKALEIVHSNYLIKTSKNEQ